MARWIRVASLSFPGGGGTGQDRAARARVQALEWIERAVRREPDLVLLPETFCALGLGPEEWIRTAEPVPGPTTEAVAERARRHGVWVVCPLVQQEGARLYNAAVLLNPAGEVAGIYRKMFPTLSEIEQGITPGDRAVVWETPLGRIGCAICFDLNFREVLEELRALRADLVLFASMYRGGLQARIWAHDLPAYLISATPGEGSVILNPLGRVLAASSAYEPIIVRHLNLDYWVGHIDYNHLQWEAIWERYRASIDIEVASPEALFLLTSHLPDTTAADIAQEFKLESLDAYLDRSRRKRIERVSV